ncbi:MAG: hypothetical protein MJA84_01335, partial [Firmicutes bacterium]|nr:hypothetical protein [Bacillota bacterium]
MNVDANHFFQSLTLKVCSNLKIETILFESFSHLRKYIPADGMAFDITEPDGTVLSIARVTLKGVEIYDVPIPLSPDSLKEAKENKGVKDVLIFNAPDLNPISKDFANRLNIAEASYLVVNLIFEDEWPASLSIHSLGQNRYTSEHARLLSMVKEPFSIALSNALKYREVQKYSEKNKKENNELYQE